MNTKLNHYEHKIVSLHEYIQVISQIDRNFIIINNVFHRVLESTMKIKNDYDISEVIKEFESYELNNFLQTLDSNLYVYNDLLIRDIYN